MPSISQQYTQSEAYKHLLDVAQNIIYSTQTDELILNKYKQLKKSILRKITQSSRQQATSSQSDNKHYINLLASYRGLIDNVIKIVNKFQEELENNMERSNYNQLIIGLNQGIGKKIEEMEEKVSIGNGSTNYDSVSSKDSKNMYQKVRLLHLQQINTFKYQFDQLDSKFENLGLLIQVHKKMHEIILQATKSEQKRQQTDQKYKQKLSILQQQISKISDIQQFIDHHKLTQQKYKQFKLSAKTLGKVLLGKK